jgi:hypothetical protein
LLEFKPHLAAPIAADLGPALFISSLLRLFFAIVNEIHHYSNFAFSGWMAFQHFLVVGHWLLTWTTPSGPEVQQVDLGIIRAQENANSAPSAVTAKVKGKQSSPLLVPTSEISNLPLLFLPTKP